MSDILKNYALVNSDTGYVEKLVYWDGVSEITIYDLPTNYELVLISEKPCMVWSYDFDTNTAIMVEKFDLVWQGMLWTGTMFTQEEKDKPVPTEEPPTTGVEPF